MAEKTGRKGFGEELELIRRYSELSDKYFAFLIEMYESGDKADKKWACERLEKAYVKMIPQDLTSGGEKLEVLPILGGISKNGISKNQSGR